MDEPLFLRIERSRLRWFGHVSRMSEQKFWRQVLLATSVGDVVQGSGGVTLSPFCFEAQRNYLGLLVTVGF